MPFKLALVDFDGTLVDSMPYWLALPVETLRRENIPEPEDFYERICIRPMWEIARYFATVRPNTTEAQLRDLWDGMMLEHYRRDISLKPGAAKLLSLFRDCGLSTVLFSATRRPYLAPAAEHFGLLPYLDEIITEEEIGPKHETKTYERLAERFGCALDEMLLVEDSPVNIRIAHSFGLGTVAVFDESRREWWAEMTENADMSLRSLLETDSLRPLLGSRGSNRK